MVMKNIHSSKYIQTIIYILSTAIIGLVVYYGFIMKDPGTGNLFEFNFNPKQIVLAGLCLGSAWVITRSTKGSNFRPYIMPQALIILWYTLLVIGAVISSTLRKPGDGRISSGAAVFIAGALLPLLLYGVVGMVIKKDKV